MSSTQTLAQQQLGRMRGMTAMYHRRFYADVWLTVTVWLSTLAAAEFGAEGLYLVLPLIALFGAVLTSFDASYLMFARHYAAALERHLNHAVGEKILVAAELEDAYLFKLRTPKVVTIGSPFTWFGFVTVFLTLLGVTAYGYGAALALQSIEGGAGVALYIGVLALLTIPSLATGLWWFVAGVGERRLTNILDATFPLR